MRLHERMTDLGDEMRCLLDRNPTLTDTAAADFQRMMEICEEMKDGVRELQSASDCQHAASPPSTPPPPTPTEAHAPSHVQPATSPTNAHGPSGGPWRGPGPFGRAGNLGVLIPEDVFEYVATCCGHASHASMRNFTDPWFLVLGLVGYSRARGYGSDKEH